MSLTAVTVLKSGGVFTPLWVDRINRQIREHIKPDRIVCLTDMDVKDCEVIPLKHNWPGYFSKMELFRPGLFETDVVLFFDLDTLIVREIREEWGAFSTLAMLSDFYRPAIPASGAMVWANVPKLATIYESFANNPKFSNRLSYGDGAIIGKHCTGRIQKIWRARIGSYKADHLQDGPKDFSVVCFHGVPKQTDLPKTNWARRYWETGEL